MKLDYNEFKESFGAWAEAFKPFIESEKMFKIYERLKSDGEKELILPHSQNTFRAFATSHPERVKVVWFLMDPYSKLYPGRIKMPQATGLT